LVERLPRRRFAGEMVGVRWLVSAELIERKIFLIRGHKVLVDSDLAELYGV
jgi:hypothetical protein